MDSEFEENSCNLVVVVVDMVAYIAGSIVGEEPFVPVISHHLVSQVEDMDDTEEHIPDPVMDLEEPSEMLKAHDTAVRPYQPGHLKALTVSLIVRHWVEDTPWASGPWNWEKLMDGVLEERHELEKFQWVVLGMEDTVEVDMVGSSGSDMVVGAVLEGQ